MSRLKSSELYFTYFTNRRVARGLLGVPQRRGTGGAAAVPHHSPLQEQQSARRRRLSKASLAQAGDGSTGAHRALHYYRRQRRTAGVHPPEP